jgi:5,10-methylenetetrahydromethanopterin reductase
MNMSMGVGLFPTEPVGRMRELVHCAEELGYDNVWIGDSQNIWRESSVVMGAAAVGTSRVVIGTGVTNPVTRHRSALASTWATLHEMTGGRVAMGIGVGDSAMHTMGLKPSRLQELETSIDDLRTLWRGRPSREGSSNTEYRLAYVDPAKPYHVPVYIGASGPKILRLSGRIADGVIILVGTDPRFITAALRTVAEGAAESGRTLDDLHLVLWTPTAIDLDPVAARDLVRSHVARVVMRPLAAELDLKQNEAVERIRSAYDYYEHMQVEAAHSHLVPDSLVDSFALAGTPDECAERVREIEALGIDQIAIIPYVGDTGDRAATMAAFARIMRGRS